MTFTLDQNWGTPGSIAGGSVTHTGTATASGALLLALVSSNVVSAHSISDNGSNTWTQVVINTDVSQTISLWYCVSAASITSATATATNSPTRTFVGIVSYTNNDGSVALSDSVSLTGSSDTSWSEGDIDVVANDLVVGLIHFTTSTRVPDTSSPYTRLFTRQQSMSSALCTGIASSSITTQVPWTLTSGAAATAKLISAVFHETSDEPSTIDVTGSFIDNTAIVTATPDTGTAPFTYAINQISGTTVTPVELSAGKWSVQKHATDTLVYNVTATDSDSLEGTDTVTIPPIPSGGGSATTIKRPTGTPPTSTWT